MDEKILIKSEVDKSVKNFLQFGSIVPFIITIICASILSFIEIRYTDYYYIDFLKAGKYATYTYSGWERIFRFNGSEDSKCFLIFLIGAISLLIGIIILALYFINHKCELQITEKCVRGKTILGKEVILPLHMVSAYSTRKFLSVIAVSTSSGVTKFSLIKNYREIGNVLSTKINERQDSTANISTPNVIVNPSNSMDDIKKLKDLLDSGIITQEEFEAKKKQLLGL